MLEKLSSGLKSTFDKVKNALFVDEKLVNELIKDIQKVLLQSDINVKLVFDVTSKIKTRILKDETPAGISKKEYLIKVLYEELVALIGGEGEQINVEGNPAKIMLVGLFGSGKTTTAGKFATYFKKRGKKIALVGLDIHRPAAMNQLEQIAHKVGVDCFIKKGEKDAVKIWHEFEPKAKEYDLVIIDTAGRDALSDDLVKEIEQINSLINPQERLLVISADIGQAAQAQAEQFHKSCNITGIIATKMDGTAKAGGALTACSVSGAKIKFIGVGEGVEDLEKFDPKGFLGRLLGMGDLEALLEKAEVAISKEDAEDLGKKLLKGEFNLIDLYEQMSALRKMGPLSKITEMIPGFGQLKLPKEALAVQEGKLEKWKYIMASCTKEELEDPDIISGSRIERIAKGSGCSSTDVRELIKQYKQSKKLVKSLRGNEKNMQKMMKNFQGGNMKFK